MIGKTNVPWGSASPPVPPEPPGTPIGSMAIGSIVQFEVNSAITDFIVVQHGKPSSIYDDSFNNTTLVLSRYLYYKGKYNASAWNEYDFSLVDTYCRTTFYNLIEERIRVQIKTLKIPYRPGNGTSSIISSGSDGLPRPVFIPSIPEVGLSGASYSVNDGAKFAYFLTGTGTDANNRRITTYKNGTTGNQWTRTPSINPSYDGLVCAVSYAGASTGVYSTNDNNTRPCFGLPSDMRI